MRDEEAKGVDKIQEALEGKTKEAKWSSLFPRVQSLAAEGNKLSYIPLAVKNSVPMVVL